MLRRRRIDQLEVRFDDFRDDFGLVRMRFRQGFERAKERRYEGAFRVKLRQRVLELFASQVVQDDALTGPRFRMYSRKLVVGADENGAARASRVSEAGARRRRTRGRNGSDASLFG